jgi:NB-ARC domain/APAF-1 helical domain
MSEQEQSKQRIEQQAGNSTLGGGMQAIVGDNNTQQDNSATQINQGNARGHLNKIEGGTNYIGENNVYNNCTFANLQNDGKSGQLKIFQAPPLPEYYVDRPEVSAYLKQRLLTNSQTLVVSAIHGLGSVGKSTLAAALVHDSYVQEHFRDGILWATLGQEPDVLSLLSSWVRSLGDYNYPVTDVHGASQHLRSLLIDKAMLLVVDDAWVDKDNGWKHVEAFKVGSARCCMLVTTRDASVGNFLGANTYSLDVMSEEQALELLSKKIQAQGKQLEAREIESAKALAKSVGYLPLALELAAVQIVGGKKWQDLIKDITQEIARLKTLQDCGVRGIVDEEKLKKLSLQASLNLSVTRLGEHEREYFVWLGVLPEDANITHKMTATLWDIDERDAEDILEYLRSQALLLLGLTLVDGTITYKLHDLFHDLARNLLTSPQKPKHQGDLIGLGINWPDAHAQLLDKYKQQIESNHWHTLSDDGYIHQYLTWHLEKAGKIEEIHQLLRSESSDGGNGWYEIREKLGQTAGYLKDVSRAWELTETDFDKNPSQIISLQCRYGLIMSSLNSLSAKIPKELLVVLIKNGYWKPEQGLAYTLQKQDLKDKAYSLIAVADYLPKNLNKQALQIALETARQIQDKKYCVHILSFLGEKLQSIDFYNEALETAGQIQSEFSRARVLSYLAKKLPKDLHNKALEITRQIQDEYFRAYVFASLAGKLQLENLDNGALEIEHQIQSEFSYTNVLSPSAQKLLSENLYKQALEIERQIHDEYFRADVLSSLAEKIQSENLHKKALEIASKIEDEYFRADFLSSLTEKIQSENLYKKILEIASQIQNEKYRVNVISSLAGKIQSENFYKKILEIISQIQNEEYRANGLSSLSKKLLENLYTEALKIAEQIKNEEYCDNVLSSIAKKLPENLYTEALEITEQIQSKKYRDNVLSSLAKKLPENLYKKVLETAGQIQNEEYRADVISSLAERLPENLHEEVLNILCQIQNEEYRTRVLLSLAERLPENLHEEALKILCQIKNELYRVRVLSSLAKKLPGNLHKEALKILRRIQQNEPYRARVILSLVEKLPENLYKEALEIALQINDEYYRDYIISSLAEKLPENLYKEKLKTARQIQGESSRTNNILPLEEKLPENSYKKALETARQIPNEEYRADVLSSLAEKLPEKFYKQTLEIACQIHNEYYRTRVLSSLVEKLPENLHKEALEVSRQIKNGYYRDTVILFLTEKFSENLYKKALEITRQIQNEEYPDNIIEKLYNKALEITCQIQNEGYQADIISSLVKKLPEKLYKKALETALQIQSEEYRAQVLSSLADKLPENLYNEALETAFQIQNEEYRAKVLSPLFKAMSLSKRENELYKMWLKITKSTLSKIKREGFQLNIGILVPIIYKLGGKDAVMEIANAIQDVGRWWR